MCNSSTVPNGLHIITPPGAVEKACEHSTQGDDYVLLDHLLTQNRPHMPHVYVSSG